MADVDRGRLQDLLGGSRLAWLRARVRRRVERGRPPTGTVALSDPSPEQRAAVDRLLGRRPSSGASVTVSLDDIDRLLRRAEVCDGLVSAVELLDGPIDDRAGEARELATAWSRLLDDLAPPGCPTWRQTWRDDLAATGLLRRLGGTPGQAVRLVGRVDQVLAGLPARGVTRARLAATTLQDSHALDDGRPVSTLVLKALQHRYLPSEERAALPTGHDRRALWAAAGVLLDELSAPVLVLGLVPRGDGLVATTLRTHAAVGEPTRVTLRALLGHPPDFAPLSGHTVHLCENPAVVSAAATRHGTDCRPLVCTDGWPSSAVQTLLRRLREAGVDLVHHGDVDPAGVAIADMLHRRFGAGPWRFDARSYRAAPAGPPLTGEVPVVAWAPGLAEAANRRGVAVHEEQVLDELLTDLGPSKPT